MFLVLALVLVFVLPWPASLAGLLTGLVLFGGEVGFWHHRVRGKPKAVGPQRLIGMEGVALSTCRPTGQARVDGAIWAARCDEGADEGERIRVAAIDGLTLIVRPAAPRRSTAEATSEAHGRHRRRSWPG